MRCDFPPNSHTELLLNGEARLTTETESVDSAPYQKSISMSHYFGYYPVLRINYIVYTNDIVFIG